MSETPKAGRSRFKIDVTQEDIEKAQRNNSYKCVVAQAVARSIPDATRIEIDVQSVRFTRAETGERLLYLTPPAAAGYVVAFDAGDEMHPFSFTLSNPVKVRRRVRTEAGRKTNNANRKAKRAETQPDGAPSVERAPSEPVAVAAEPAAAAAAIKQEYAEAAKSVTVSGTHPPRPRTYKTGKRVYGSRILRVNRYLREASETAEV